MKRFFKILGVNILIMIVVVVLMIVGINAWLDNYTHHNESIIVPEVKGLIDDEAIYSLERAGLVPMVIDSLYADATPGSVIEQLPEAGLPVKKGRIVYLTINAKSVRMITMPEVADFSSRQAKSILREAGFVVSKVEEAAYEFDDLVLRVKVGDTVILPGESLPYHTNVTLVVGSTSVSTEIEAVNDGTEEAFFE